MPILDEADFLSTPISGANSTKFASIPVVTSDGEPIRYCGVIEALKTRASTGKDGKSYTWLDVNIRFDVPPELKLKLQSFQSRYSFSLDLAEDNTLDRSADANVRLGRLRTAVDMNNPDPKAEFKILDMIGAPIAAYLQVDGEYTKVKSVEHI